MSVRAEEPLSSLLHPEVRRGRDGWDEPCDKERPRIPLVAARLTSVGGGADRPRSLTIEERDVEQWHPEPGYDAEQPGGAPSPSRDQSGQDEGQRKHKDPDGEHREDAEAVGGTDDGPGDEERPRAAGRSELPLEGRWANGCWGHRTRIISLRTTPERERTSTRTFRSGRCGRTLDP